MTDLEVELLNMFADDVMAAARTEDQVLFEACQKEYDDYLAILKRRIAERANTHV